MKQKEDDCSRELSLKEQKRKELYAKQGRGSQFTSKDERDRWIQNELKYIFSCFCVNSVSLFLFWLLGL